MHTRHIFLSVFAGFLLFLTSLPPAFGQVYLSDDVVYLRNGNIIRGRIVEQTDDVIKIELLGGTILVYSQDEIEKIQGEPSPYRKIKVRLGRDYRQTTFRQKGLYHIVTTDWTWNESDWGGARLDPHFHYAAGYHFNRYVNLGIGTGLDPYESGLIIPWYLDFRGDLWHKKVTPTYYVQAGYGFSAIEGWQINRMDGGLMLTAGAGWKINTPGKAEWLFTLGYKMQNTYQERFTWGGWGGWWEPNQPLIIGSRQYRKIVMQIALGF